MAIFRPGTGETDPYKINLSLQAIASAADTNITNIATNTSDIATLQASRASSSTFGLAEVDNVTITAAAGVLSTVNPLPAPIHASLGSDTAISNSVYTDGPSIAQGTSGTWFVSGTVTLSDSAGAARFSCKLWDGTTVIASASITQSTVATTVTIIALSGYLATPAGNIRISCTSNAAGATSTFKFNSSGNSKDCTISAYRIA